MTEYLSQARTSCGIRPDQIRVLDNRARRFAREEGVVGNDRTTSRHRADEEQRDFAETIRSSGDSLLTYQ